MSGVTVDDKVTLLIGNMKLKKNEDDPEERVKLAIFTIKGDKVIGIEKTFTKKELGDETCFCKICEEMNASSCFYALYDCCLETDRGPKDDLIFLTWTSDCGTVKDKMLYASSKQSLKVQMKGVKHHIQVNDCSDWTRQAVAEKIQETSTCVVAKIEGVDV